MHAVSAAPSCLYWQTPTWKNMVKNPPANAGDVRNMRSIPALGRSPGGRHGNHPSILAWRIPWKEEPGGLRSVGSQSQTRLKWLSMHKEARQAFTMILQSWALTSGPLLALLPLGNTWNRFGSNETCGYTGVLGVRGHREGKRASRSALGNCSQWPRLNPRD